jgi:2-polyprenyl-3-methyl-5-hydroxy-6-metoxy-1,4-benzoquinol methylase
MDWYARFVREQFDHWPTSVLDIGCNDGSQLDAFKRIGFTTYGVDPATNLHTVSSGKGHDVKCDFWPTQHIFDTQFDVITTQNAFAHIPDPLTYLQSAASCLKHDGMIFISTSQADMVLNGEFDTIYHEHISFYNAASMKALADRAGLCLIDVVKTPIHGTSYIFILAKTPKNQQRIENILAMEAAAGLINGSTYRTWANDVTELISNLRDTVTEYQSNGYTIVGYGAAAKGMTLINASGIELNCVIDDNPLKQGLYCPGADIPVVDINWLTDLDTSTKVLFIPLAWNFYREIKSKILKVRSNPNDLFMTYFPKIKIEQ